MLKAIEQGDSKAAETLLREVYDQLRRLAAARLSHEKLIDKATKNIAGMELTFYPPVHIKNQNYEQDYPVYNYFASLVNDNASYITGTWCEYGTGGGRPHLGIDVAAKIGSEIMTPISGTAPSRRASPRKWKKCGGRQNGARTR